VSLGTAWSVLQVYPSTRPQAVVGLWLSNQRWKVKNTKKGSQLDWLYFVKLGQAYPESELVMCHIPITPFQLKNSTIPPNFISCQSNIYIYTYIYMYVTSNKSQYISYGIVIYNIICKYTYYIYMYVYIYILYIYVYILCIDIYCIIIYLIHVIMYVSLSLCIYIHIYIFIFYVYIYYMYVHGYS
jgi:hypothetical protein